MTDHNIELTRRTILASAGVVGAAGAGAGLGTSALFSDTEQFTNNAITAGTANLTVAAGIVGVSEELAAAGTVELVNADNNSGGDPDVLAADGSAQVGLTVADMKPGDWIILRTTVVVEGNPMFVTARATNADDSEHRSNPEAEFATQNGGPNPDVEDGSGAGNGSDAVGDGNGDDAGDLDNQLLVTLGYDDDRNSPHDNSLEGTLVPESGFDGSAGAGSTVTDFVAALQSGVQYRGRDGPSGSPPGGHGDGSADLTRIGGDRSRDPVDREMVTHFITFELPADVGNVVQGDSVSFDLVFTAEQVRHNDRDSSTTPSPIQDWTDLDDVRNDLDGDYVLVADLNEATAGYDAVASASANGGDGFEPIGGNSPDFTGTFDGNGNSISGLVIDRGLESEVGLFGAVGDGGTITDVRLTDVDVSGGAPVGALAGRSTGTVDQSSVDGSADGDAQVATLVGLNENQGTVVRGSANGSVDATSGIAGGLVGRNDGEIRDGSATVDVTTSNVSAGGLVGANGGEVDGSTAFGDVEATASAGGLVGTNSGSVSVSDANGRVDGEVNTGGLVGTNADEGTVSSSGATGEVTGFTSTGGVAGSNSGRIEASSAGGPVQNSGLGSAEIGGFVGNNTGEVTDSTATGGVDGNGAKAVGGFAGTNADGTVSRSAAYGDVRATNDKSNDTTAAHGGLVGSNSGEVSESAAFGDTDAARIVRSVPLPGSGTQAVGALVGTNIGGTVRRSFARGLARGHENIGGLVGQNGTEDSEGTVSNCYTSGSVDGTVGVGSLVGLNDSKGSVENTYWEEEDDTDAFGQDKGNSTNVNGLTTDQMQDSDAKNNMSALDFTTVWQTVSDEYPTLQTVSD